MLEEQVRSMIENEFGGNDMVQLSWGVMNDMTPEQCHKLFLITCNSLGEVLHGRVPANSLEAAQFLNRAILHALIRWDDAITQAQTTTDVEGTA